jgi:Rieske Fe-S protein
LNRRAGCARRLAPQQSPADPLGPETLGEETRGRAADGIAAYSAVCTHQGCDVTNWTPRPSACGVHATTRNTTRGKAARVVNGPLRNGLPRCH